MRDSQDRAWEDILKRQNPPPHVSEPEISTPDASAPEDEDLGPCASRPMPKGWNGIYIQNRTEDTHAFQYMHLGYEKFAANGKSFVIEFNINVAEKWRVTVHGRRLWRIFLNLHHHKLEWIKTADKDFDGKQPIITAIAVEPVPEAEAPRQKVTRPELVDG